MLIVDAGPLVAYLNRNDPDHSRCAALLATRTDELLVTPYVVTEACYLVGKYVGPQAEINLVLTVVDLADEGVMRGADDVDVGRPRPGWSGGALVGVLRSWSSR